jgi:hypothetical protein
MAANDDISRFSALLRATDQAEQEVKAAERAQDAKAGAAQALKSVRQRKHSQEELRAADHEYRIALANLVELEQGERPQWAPAVESAANGESDSGNGESGSGNSDSGNGESGSGNSDSGNGESGVGEVDESLQRGQVEGVPAHQDEMADAGVEVGAGVSVGADES